MLRAFSCISFLFKPAGLSNLVTVVNNLLKDRVNLNGGLNTRQ